MSLADDKRAQARKVVAEVGCPVCGQSAGYGCISVTGVALMVPHDARRGAHWRLVRHGK